MRVPDPVPKTSHPKNEECTPNPKVEKTTCADNGKPNQRKEESIKLMPP